MEFVSRKVDGPAVTSKTRKEALTELYDHPAFPKNARVEDIEEVDGQWIATLGIPKQADFPFSDDGGDEGPSKPKDKSKNDFEGPNGDTDSEPKDESDSSDDESSDDSDDSGDDKKKGESKEISELKGVVDAIANALGIPIPGAEGDSPVPGQDGLDSPDGPPPPPGMGGPPPGGPPPPHDKPMHPGEAPPGTTPVGAPAFSKVQNPFPEHIGKQKAFEISDITNRPLGECVHEIKSMIEPFGYYVHQAKTNVGEDGQRRVAALVADHPPKS